MTYLDSSIPSTIFCCVFGAEILRSTRTINGATLIQRNSKILINQMTKQEGEMTILSTTLNKLFCRYFDVFTSTIILLLNLLNRL